MAPTEHPLEQRLLEGYQEQLRLYDQALAIVDRNADPAGATANQDWPHELHAVLGDLAILDAAMAGDKTAWRQSAQPPSPELSGLLDQVARRIATLGDAIKGHVERLRARREIILPEIDEFIQRRRMLEAYGKYGDRQHHGVPSI